MRYKKIISVCLIAAIAFVFPANSFAGAWSQTYNGSFKKKWSLFKKWDYDYTSGNNAGRKIRITYGFNTAFINEDTLQAYDNGDRHRARIKNGNGTHYGKWKYANDYSDLEVRHSGKSVTYSNVTN